MRTEAEIIYTIWSIVRGGEINADDPINERLMRRFLQIHRGNRIDRLFKQTGHVPDEVFQNIGPVNFTIKNNEYVSTTLPKTVRMLDNFGFKADIDGYVISVVDSEEYRLAKKDKFNKYHPMIKLVNNKMYLSNGLNKEGILEDISNSLHNQVVDKLKFDFNQSTTQVSMQAVLVNPDDEAGYDFTRSPYPFPDDLIEDLINSVNAREFNLFLRMKSDETGDMRNDAKQQDTDSNY